MNERAKLEDSIPTWGDAIVWSESYKSDSFPACFFGLAINTFCPITQNCFPDILAGEQFFVKIKE